MSKIQPKIQEEDIDITKDELEEHPFFHYYGMLQHQQNMLQDYVRTGTYQKAIINNISDFKGKVVLDVGTGTGILSFFAAQAGAKKVYAIEISKMADYAKKLVQTNHKEKVIEVIQGKVEEVELPEKVDIIISEPMGFFLVHERMLESYIIARQRFLKEKGGKMFPSVGTIYISLFQDQSLFDEQFDKVQFWNQTDFYGVDVSELYKHSIREMLSQPIIGYFNPNQLVSDEKATYLIDFLHNKPEDLHEIDIPFRLRINKACVINGIANWFDVSFNGSNEVVVLSTAPDSDYTHWYQCRLLFPTPIGANEGQYLTGNIHMVANLHKSYNMEVKCQLEGTEFGCHSYYNLQDQMYQYLQQQQQQPSS